MLRHLLLATLLAIPMMLHATEVVRIEVRHSDDIIRDQLLQLTPRGTPTAAVFQFAQSRLHRDSSVVGWPPKQAGERFGNFIDTELGHYFEAQNLFVFPTVVQAFWYFDKNDKLRDIRVRRFVRGW